MSRRLWYPQLDVYDAIRRLAGLLALWDAENGPSQERLYIADFYLANPPLLHKTHMKREVRNAFNELAIPRPEKSFISYPSPPMLFQKMDEVQREAFRTLSGKGLVDLPKLDKGTVVPSAAGRELFEDRFITMFDAAERKIAEFLTNSFAPTGESIAALRISTGLRRVLR